MEVVDLPPISTIHFRRGYEAWLSAAWRPLELILSEARPNLLAVGGLVIG